MVQGQTLEYVAKYKYLGFILDPYLKFDDMMQSLIRTVTHKLYLLAKVRSMLTRRAAVAVYKSLVLSYIDYSSISNYLSGVHT